MVQKELYESVLSEARENIHLQHCIVNIDTAKKYEEELFEKGIYLPNLLRGVLSKNYFQKLNEKNLLKSVESLLVESYNYSREESINEFVEWIKNHKEYSSLLNHTELKSLNEELGELEKYG